MDKKAITFDEVVELFLFDTISYIASEKEVPKLVFSFSNEAFSYFDYLSKHPFSYVSSINEKNINKLHNLEKEVVPIIIIKDYKKFFNLLKDIINKTFSIAKYYNIHYNSPRSLSLLIMRRIWLKMNAQDFTYPAEEFLQKQLSFLEHDLFFDNRNCKLIATYQNYFIYGANTKSQTWDESNFLFLFTAYDNAKPIHTLPNILYDVTYQNKERVCFISGVQNPNERLIDKKFNRKLYELNNGITNPQVHPSSILSLIIFLNILIKNNITKIVVPTLQVLSYRYHELISDNIKNEELKAYEKNKENYDRFVDKEDFISKNKCENLLYMFYQLQDMGIVKITTEPFIECENLQVKIINPMQVVNILARRM